MDITGATVWMLPLTDVQHFDYGRKGKLLISTQHGLYEADSRLRRIHELKKPTSGKCMHLVLKALVWCSLQMHYTKHKHGHRDASHTHQCMREG